MARMDIKEYKERVIDHFRAGTERLPCAKATKEDWQLLGLLFLNASENGEENLEEFDKRILSEQEFKELYERDQQPEW